RLERHQAGLRHLALDGHRPGLRPQRVRIRGRVLLVGAELVEVVVVGRGLEGRHRVACGGSRSLLLARAARREQRHRSGAQEVAPPEHQVLRCHLSREAVSSQPPHVLLLMSPDAAGYAGDPPHAAAAPTGPYNGRVAPSSEDAMGFLKPIAAMIYAGARILVGLMFFCHGLQKLFGLFGGMPAGAPTFIVYAAA